MFSFARGLEVHEAAYQAGGHPVATVASVTDFEEMIMKKLLIGVSALALGLTAASGAWANPKNTFSNNNVTTLTSAATATGGAAYSESYNTNTEAVSYQSLSAVALGASLSVVSIPIFSGNAIASDIHDNAGVTNASANTGNGTVAQQAVSLGVVGTVTIN
jgi:hypothetical protein